VLTRFLYQQVTNVLISTFHGSEINNLTLQATIGRIYFNLR